jgi:hypothetical protein
MAQVECNGGTNGSVNDQRKSAISRFVESRSWEHSSTWHGELLEALFKIKERETTIAAEIYGGIVQYVACIYFLPVIPQKMEAAGYNTDNTFVVSVRNHHNIIAQRSDDNHKYRLWYPPWEAFLLAYLRICLLSSRRQLQYLFSLQFTFKQQGWADPREMLL